jgi:hypothetical protein
VHLTLALTGHLIRFQADWIWTVGSTSGRPLLAETAVDEERPSRCRQQVADLGMSGTIEQQMPCRGLSAVGDFRR